MTFQTSEKLRFKQLSEGRFTTAEASVITEKDLPVFVNERHLFTASITPAMEKEFVAGYLFGQGFIENIADIASLDVESNKVKVALIKAKNTPDLTEKTSYRIVSGGGKMAYFENASLPEIHSSIKIRVPIIFQAINAMFENAILYRETEGVHAAGLFTPEAEPICIVEEIGRHNSLDKVIGYALLHEIDCSNAFLVCTGRMASEMVMKICRAGIPVVATKTAVTDKGLEIGKKCGLTLIGFVRDIGTKIHTDMETRISQKAQMKIYTGAERITY